MVKSTSKDMLRIYYSFVSTNVFKPDSDDLPGRWVSSSTAGEPRIFHKSQTRFFSWSSGLPVQPRVRVGFQNTGFNTNEMVKLYVCFFH
ncbi:hypothetical protein YC2023_094561 [Brassica napus]